MESGSIAVLDPPAALVRALLASPLAAVCCSPGKEEEPDGVLCWRPESWFSCQGLLRRLQQRGVTRHFLFCYPSLPPAVDFMHSNHPILATLLQTTAYSALLLLHELFRFFPRSEQHPLLLGFLLPRLLQRNSLLEEVIYTTFKSLAERCVEQPIEHCQCYGIVADSGQEEELIRVIMQAEEQLHHSSKRWFLLQHNKKQVLLEPGSKKLPV